MTLNLIADVLVACLLVATIVTCFILTKRIERLKADEAGMRQTVGALITATDNAERAIAGLKSTLGDCDRTLEERLRTAERYAADLAAQVEAGQAVMALVADDSFYVQAYFEETKLPGIRVGASAEVILMSGSEPLQGKVQSISRGITDRNAAADAQLLADVEPTFNWVRLAQRIPVRIAFDEVPADFRMIAGRTATVSIIDDSTKAGARP